MSLRAKRSNLLFSSGIELFQPGDCSPKARYAVGGSTPPRNDIKFVVY
jgi:hypothetical protein